MNRDSIYVAAVFFLISWNMMQSDISFQTKYGTLALRRPVLLDSIQEYDCGDITSMWCRITRYDFDVSYQYILYLYMTCD